MKSISIAHSPDTDDVFLFWALREKLISAGNFAFTFEAMDTEDLNEAARQELYDVTAISLAAYPQIADNYLILPHGASVGRNYGPVVLSTRDLSLQDLNTCTVGVPGNTTTAALILRKIAPQVKTVEVPLTPYGLIFEKLQRGELDAAVVIHEGQISFARETFKLVMNLGRWWNDKAQLPLPVGVNVIHQRLGDELIAEVSTILRQSIQYALSHRERIIPQLFQRSKSHGAKLRDETQLDEYLSLYANQDSLSLDTECRRAIELLVGTSVRYAP